MMRAEGSGLLAACAEQGVKAFPEMRSGPGLRSKVDRTEGWRSQSKAEGTRRGNQVRLG